MNIDASKENFERVELFGKPALFTNFRIDRATVPNSLHCYDLRGSGSDPGKINSVEPHVWTNHSGAVITAEPIDFGGKEYRTVRGKIYFLGEGCTLEGFCADQGIEYAPLLKYDLRAADENEAALFFSGTAEEDALRGCAGHMRFDFGSLGNGFHHTWWEHTKELKTDAFRDDMQEVVNHLRDNGPLSDLNQMARFCRSHENARFPNRIRSESYGFKLESEHYSYYLRCFPHEGDYSYLYCYDKSLLQTSVMEQSEPQAEGSGSQMGGQSL